MSKNETCRVHPNEPLRLSGVGVPYCPACRREASTVIRQKVQQTVAQVEFDSSPRV